MDDIVYGCYFCGESILKKTGDSHLDPCAMVFVAHFDKDRRDQKEQQFYCHFECFRKLGVGPNTFYIEEPDFSTIGEIEDEEEL
jgi:hypothetical protein